MNTVVRQPMYGWNTLSWKKVEPVVFKRQKRMYRAQCCGDVCKAGDLLEVDHILPKAQGGKDAYHNWQLLHRHCHDAKTAEDRRRYAYQAPDS